MKILFKNSTFSKMVKGQLKSLIVDKESRKTCGKLLSIVKKHHSAIKIRYMARLGQLEKNADVWSHDKWMQMRKAATFLACDVNDMEHDIKLLEEADPEEVYVEE
jgi:hypothetical protein